MPRRSDETVLEGPVLAQLEHPLGAASSRCSGRSSSPRAWSGWCSVATSWERAGRPGRRDEHVKLVFPDPDTGVTRHPVPDGDHLDWPRPFPPTREYTVRRYDAEAGEVWMDFVVHLGGLASDWALSAEPGDRVWVAGPRSGCATPDAFTYRVILADHTALPAVARMLEELPDGVRARVAVLVPDRAEEQELVVRAGVHVTWLHEDDGSAADGFGPFLTALDLPADEPWTLWAGGEAGLLKPVRRWAKEHGLVNGTTADISGYWKRGRTNEVTTRRRVAHRVRHALRLDAE